MDLSFMGHTECEVDLTGETITIYHIGDLSGPYAPITQPLLAGITDVIAFYNEHGLACGATLEQMYEDTGSDHVSKTYHVDSLFIRRLRIAAR